MFGAIKKSGVRRLGCLRSQCFSSNSRRAYGTNSTARSGLRWKDTLVGGAGAASAILLYYAAFSPSRADAREIVTAKSTYPLSEVKDPVYATADETRTALAEIKAAIGADNVSTDGEIADEHADSPWQTRHRKSSEVASAVVYPSSTEDVSKILKICHKYRVPVTPFSGGTSLEGHFTPVYGGVSLDMGKMNNIVELHKDDLDVVVQPAVGWEDLDEYLKDYNLMFGPDPGPGAEIGGMVGTSCSGTNAYRYGTMRTNVVNLTVVLADGTVIKTKRRPRKSSAGYSMTELFIGAEGTLGIVTEATLRLSARPKVIRVGLLTFNDIENATKTVQSVLLSGIQLDAMELMDDKQMRIINQAGSTSRRWDEKHTLLLRFAGTDGSDIEASVKNVRALAKDYHPLDLVFTSSDDETEELWAARKNALWSVMGAAPEGYKMWTTDVAVPISKLSTIIGDAKSWIDEHGVMGTILGHVGDGNFHAIFGYDPKTEKEKVEDISHRLVMRAIELDGTCTGEHGIGVGKRHYLLEESGEDDVAAMRNLKSALDPYFILNPGKVFSVAQHDVSDH